MLAVAIVVSATFAVGCGSSPTFCSIVLQPHAEFRAGTDSDAQHRRQISTLNAIIASLPKGVARDDMLTTRDYAEVLYGTRTYSSQPAKERIQLGITKRFFGGASQRLDRQLRDECKIDLGDSASPFDFAPSKNT